MSKANRLAKETSPYLLQHAYNVVDWYPWGDEALIKAAELDRPIFLSIGYSTCHWCHVMEKNVFENEALGKAMNEAFINIKVDREERPDIDRIYMLACLCTNGRGGWPLSVVMTPDCKPFFCGTYIPPQTVPGSVGMDRLIPRIADAWRARRSDLVKSADVLVEALRADPEQKVGDQRKPRISNVGNDVDAASIMQSWSDALDHGFREGLQSFDTVHGGFGTAPKFPSPHKLVFLLRYGGKRVSPGLKAVEETLVQMRKGGIFDHIGFGFHRYSTTSDWLLPHFEKMLYDQALMAYAFTEAYEVTGKQFFADVAREIFSYVLRDMTCPKTGAFFAAEDADSDGEEGLFYIWKSDEFHTVLGEDGAAAASLWSVRPDGNFNDEATGRKMNHNVLHWKTIPSGEPSRKMEEWREKLFSHREYRNHPLKDDKILTDWNGMMIAALAKAGRTFRNPNYIAAAIRAAKFVETRLSDAEHPGKLRHWSCKDERGSHGFLDDYSYVCHGLIELYRATWNAEYLRSSLTYIKIIEQFFKDEAAGGYFLTDSSAASDLFLRPKEIRDGAVPSGNSMHLLNQLMLSRMLQRQDFSSSIQHSMKAYETHIDATPSDFCQALVAAEFGNPQDRRLGTKQHPRESLSLVVVGDPKSADTKAILDFLDLKVYNPSMTILLKPETESEDVSDLDQYHPEVLAEIAPHTVDLHAKDGKCTVYICTSSECEPALNTLEDLRKRFDACL